MKTSRSLIAASTAYMSLPSLAVNPHPDPQNPTGYIIARIDIQNSEASKTSNPMYTVWAEALQTASNSVVDSIDAGLATNPSNVKRAERVFPRNEWDFL